MVPPSYRINTSYTSHRNTTNIDQTSHFFTFETTTSRGFKDKFDIKWLDVATKAMKSITNLKELHMLDVYMNDIAVTKKYVKLT